mmetsp:Transcript_18562/g.55458  ORF Transcript_18562/g.55458 Transcript_18562/m.55458 type:complete len:362 (-) Transcript_18562:4-1089(-)
MGDGQEDNGACTTAPPSAASSAAAFATREEADSLPWVGRDEQALEQWDFQRFRFVTLLQEAPRNSGRVELCEDIETSQMVAVKAMPLSWTCDSHEAFLCAHPEENEFPWRDFEATRYLCRTAGLSCVCNFVGLFERETEAHGAEICLVLSYCSGGDLFSWLERGLPITGYAREIAARPLMRKVLEAVRAVHAHGIAHGDLSLENVLLDTEETDPEAAVIRLIDFGACTGVRSIGARGKPSYQAPEVHSDQEYSALAADTFSVGVMVFTLVVGTYPWQSTRTHVCPCFRFAAERGLPAYLARRKIKRGGRGEIVSLAELLSAELIELLVGMLAVDSGTRLSIAGALTHPWFSARSSACSNEQ